MHLSSACLSLYKSTSTKEIDDELTETLKHAPNKQGGTKFHVRVLYFISLHSGCREKLDISLKTFIKIEMYDKLKNLHITHELCISNVTYYLDIYIHVIILKLILLSTVFVAV